MATDHDPSSLWCDRCAKPIHPGRGDYYLVRIDAVADPAPPVLTEEDLAIEPGLSRPASWDRKRRRLVGWMTAVSVLLGLAGAVGLWQLLSQGQVAARAPAPEPAVNRKELAKNVYIEVQGETRRVVLKAKVCLREGQLEGLLCKIK